MASAHLLAFHICMGSLNTLTTIKSNPHAVHIANHSMKFSANVSFSLRHASMPFGTVK